MCSNMGRPGPSHSNTNSERSLSSRTCSLQIKQTTLGLPKKGGYVLCSAGIHIYVSSLIFFFDVEDDFGTVYARKFQHQVISIFQTRMLEIDVMYQSIILQCLCHGHVLPLALAIVNSFDTDVAAANRCMSVALHGRSEPPLSFCSDAQI